MYKIIGVDEQEYGPVSEDQLRQWLAEQRVNGQTKVQHAGATTWQPLASLPEFAGAFAKPGSWTCAKCGETIEAQFDTCWRCSSPRSSQLPIAPQVIPPSHPSPPPRFEETHQVRWRVEYEMFRGTLATWDELFNRASEFATNLGRDRLIGISHSEDSGDGVIAVWYWTRDTDGS